MEKTVTANIVCYHYPCHDGAFAALAAHLHFASTRAAVRLVPNRVFAPCTVTDLQLQVHTADTVAGLQHARSSYAQDAERLLLQR